MKSEQKQEFVADGFSSEEEVHHEQIVIEENKHAEVQTKDKQNVKFKIPPPAQIKNNNYSLHADLATGWAPKADLPVPVPMTFQNPRLDTMVRRLIEHPNDKVKLCYLGPRFQNTFYAWYDKEFVFPYTHILAPQNMIFTNRAFCGQHWQAQECVIFNSFFESGNLDCAIKVGERQYDLFLRVDSNTRGHLHWYNFKIKNLQKLQKYKFNICNFQKCQSLYSRGMKPYIFSFKKNERFKTGWEQSGQYIRYETKPSKSGKLMNFQYYFCQSD